MTTSAKKVEKNDANRDPITSAPGSQSASNPHVFLMFSGLPRPTFEAGQCCKMTVLSHEVERQAMTGHETSAVTTQFGEGIHERTFGESQAAPLDDEPVTTEEVAMPIMTASQSPTTATKHRPTLVQFLPFSPEPISPVVAPSPPPDSRFAFKLGAWERLVVAAELDRESLWLSPAP